MQKKDSIFQDENSPDIFRFNRQVAEVFDDMLHRSVPFYQEVIGMTGQVLESLLKPGDRVYDLGCSTGSCLIALARKFTGRNVEFVGIDNSPDMLEKARRKATKYVLDTPCKFIADDLTNAELERAGGVILNYTLQFVEPATRLEVLKKINTALRPGGVLIVSEKISAADPDLADHFAKFHSDFKRRHGYSELEISKKREALENILIPLTLEENRDLLRQAGFSKVETFFQWFNFVSLVAIKV